MEVSDAVTEFGQKDQYVFREFYRTYSFISKHPLARRHKCQASLRWIRWQIASRILPFPIAVPFIGTMRLVQERGMTGATGNFYAGLHEFAEMALALHFLRSQDAFFDIGSNVGSFTLLAGGVCNAECFSFEPVPSTFERLERNIRFNGLEERVHCYRTAVGESEGSIPFSSDMDTKNQVVDSSYIGKIIDVPVVRLDTLWSQLDQSMDAIMWKVDVEGFEEHVLSGAKSFLSDPRLKVVLLEANNDSIQATMKNAEFKQANYAPFQRCLEEGTISPAGQNNQIWVRDFDFVRKRLESASQFEAMGERI